MSLARRNAVFGLFLLALIVAAADSIRGFMALVSDGEGSHSSYTLLIPFITGALVFFNRKAIFSKLGTSPVPAVVAWLVGGVLYYIGRTYGQAFNENDQFAIRVSTLIAMAFGGFLLIYGSAAFKAALFPLMFSCLAIPIPSRITDEIVVALQKGSAEMVAVLFTITQTPVYRNDFIFALPSVSIEVAEECSGIRSTIGMFVVALLAAHLLLRSNWRRSVLLALVVPISLLKNAVRIVTLTLLAVNVDAGFLTGSLHHEGGLVFMVGGLCLMYPILLMLVKSETKEQLCSGGR